MSVVWILFVVLGLVVAASDILAFRIPNWGTLAILALFAGIVALHHADFVWFDHLGAAALALAGGIAFFALRQVGAGDAKLFAAFSLWSGFGALIPLLFFTAVAGLAELIVILGLRRLMPRLQSLSPGLARLDLPRVLAKKQGVPLGVGIVLGAIIASHWFPAWLWAA